MYYLDMIWHKPDRTTITKQEFDAKLSEIIKQEEWIIDGNYGRTLEMRFKECDTVFFLDLPTNVCLAGVEGRIGSEREDMPWQEEELSGRGKQECEYSWKMQRELSGGNECAQLFQKG